MSRRGTVFAFLDLLGAGVAVILLLGLGKLQEMHAKLDSADGTTDVPYMAFAWSLGVVIAVEAVVSAVYRARSASGRPVFVRVMDIARWTLVAAGVLFIGAGLASLASI